VEFKLIQLIQQGSRVSFPAGSDHGVVLGIGDDAAIIKPDEGEFLVATTDTLNAGVHFPDDTLAYDIGYKSLAVNLSDLAAMGALPRWVLLSLSMPGSDPEWVADFAAGFRSLAQKYCVALIGGDTTCGSLSINMTAIGTIKPGRQLLRSGAVAGDLIVVSGTVGGAARVLDLLREAAPGVDRRLLDRPAPRVELGQALTSFASSCIDVSDGLLADLGHLLEASKCGAKVLLENLPADDVLGGLDDKQRWDYQLCGGDDYELLFTVPPEHKVKIADLRGSLKIELSIIGEVLGGHEIVCIDPHGERFHPHKTGYQHFK